MSARARLRSWLRSLRAIHPFTAFGRGTGSLRVRLILAASISSGLAVAVAGTSMVILVNRHIERRVVQELRAQLDQLTAHFSLDGDDPDVRSELADPRYDRPLSGLYWQVSENGEPKIRSRSLWDQVLPLEGEELDGSDKAAFQVAGPRQQTLIAELRVVKLGKTAEGADRSFSLVVALDRAEIDQLIEDFAWETGAFLLVLVLFLALAGWVQVTVGLRPLDGLRAMVLAVRRGRAERLVGSFPDEVVPLVEEVNALIEAQTHALERARGRAGDLAHGLKTPLAIIASETRSLRERGLHAEADAIDTEIIGMSRFVERQLARARVGSYQPFGLRIALGGLVERLVRTMKRLPDGDRLEWAVHVDASVGVALHSQDADEIFGNLLDNARKFAASRVTISAEESQGEVRIHIADDGPGVPPSRREIVLLRGRRLDENVQGSGLGLSIVDDLVASYRGRLTLADTEGGGLTVELVLPSGADAADGGGKPAD